MSVAYGGDGDVSAMFVATTVLVLEVQVMGERDWMTAAGKVTMKVLAGGDDGDVSSGYGVGSDLGSVIYGVPTWGHQRADAVVEEPPGEPTAPDHPEERLSRPSASLPAVLLHIKGNTLVNNILYTIKDSSLILVT